MPSICCQGHDPQGSIAMSFSHPKQRLNLLRRQDHALPGVVEPQDAFSIPDERIERVAVDDRSATRNIARCEAICASLDVRSS